MRGRFTARISDRAVIGVVIAAVVFFCRAWLIRDWGSPLPFWDQWDAEAIGLYAPWLKSELHWADLFKAHNEHRIFLTRTADLALFVAYGGWNPWAQMLLNATLHAATAAALGVIFWPGLPLRNRALFIGGLTLLFVVTCGWQNALFGFQSQVYFSDLLALVGIAGLAAGQVLRGRWWLGLTAAALAFLANAGGILAAMASLITGLACAWGTPRTGRTWIALSLVAAVIVVAILLGANPPQHIPFHAKNVSQFFTVLTHCLAWPWINKGAISVIMQLPLGWLVIDRWRRREPLDTIERFAVALGLFSLLQSAAIAYTRGAVLPESRPLSRYQDPLLLGVAAQFFALIKLTSRPDRAGRKFAFIWSGVAVAGLISLTETNFTLHLPYKRAQDQANLTIVQEYAASGNPLAFTRDPNFSGPHPDPHVVQRVLDDPALRATLPVEVLAPPGNAINGPPWVIRHSPMLTAISGIFLLGLLLLASHRASLHR